jgi:hypothetical protein
MGILDTIILEDIKESIRNLGNRTRNRGQVDVFASHAEALISEQDIQNESVMSIEDMIRT